MMIMALDLGNGTRFEYVQYFGYICEFKFIMCCVLFLAVNADLFFVVFSRVYIGGVCVAS